MGPIGSGKSSLLTIAGFFESVDPLHELLHLFVGHWVPDFVLGAMYG
jgi:hypothetical protein